MRKEFEMTKEEYEELLDACKPTRRAWQKLGKKHGFNYMTVRPIPNKDSKFFTAELLPEKEKE